MFKPANPGSSPGSVDRRPTRKSHLSCNNKDCLFLHARQRGASGVAMVPNVQLLLHWFRFHGLQDVRRDRGVCGVWGVRGDWNGACAVRTVSETEQCGDGMWLQLLPTGRRLGYLLKLALLKMILTEPGGRIWFELATTVLHPLLVAERVSGEPEQLFSSSGRVGAVRSGAATHRSSLNKTAQLD